ncbi:MAG: hypothetical protein RKE49_08825 [Oceanicaulis sp.]
MIDSAGRGVLQRVRRELVLRCILLARSLAGLPGLAAWVLSTGRDRLGGPWQVIAVLLGFWIWPAILAHAVNNAVGVAFVSRAAEGRRLQLQIPYLAPALIVMGDGEAAP